MHWQSIWDDLAGFTCYMAELFHTMATVKGVDLRVESNKEVIDADFGKDKREDILSNLLTKALKFTPVGGHGSFRLTTNDK